MGVLGVLFVLLNLSIGSFVTDHNYREGWIYFKVDVRTFTYTEILENETARKNWSVPSPKLPK